MIKTYFLFVVLIIFSVAIFSFLSEKSFAQENQINPPRYQWKQLADPDVLTCKESLILLQKLNGYPICVSSFTYLKLIDRGYAKFDLSQLMKRPEMINHLMREMVIDSQLMHHWHTMMINDPNNMKETIPSLIFQIKENPEFLKNIMGPMTTNSDLREQMIEHMKNHNQMMNSFQQHSRWMSSVHGSMTGSNMSQGMNSGMHENPKCSWCPEVKQHNLQVQRYHQPKIMENLTHHFWINEKMRTQMNHFMFENPGHMVPMIGQLMEPMLELMMDDPELRSQMIEMMLENQEFMNSIRHKNNFSN